MLFGLAALACALPFSASATTYYTYDILGRVIQVVESDGTTTQYTYDANGNVTSITRTAGTSTLSISSISSTSGAAGSSVTITGTGFSSIPSQDTVAFNGVSGTVTYANGNRIVVTVPIGASTGDISVTTPSATATSNSPFTVEPVAITGLSPTSGSDGTVVTIAGSGFDPNPSNDAVALNGTPASVSSASATQLQFSVPTGAMAGHVTVSTSAGFASSSNHFFVPAADYSSSDVVSVADLTTGGPGEIYTTDASSQVAVGLFDGSAGQMMTFVFTNVTMGGRYVVYSPDASTFTTGSITNNQFIKLPPLPLGGTYSLYLVPGSSIGSASVSLQTDAAGTLLTNGTPAPVSLAIGQDASYTFTGTAGQSYSLELTQFTSLAQATVAASILNSDGTVAANCGIYYSTSSVPGNCDFTLATSGTYTVHLVQGGLYSSSFNILLNQDFAATLTAGTPGPTVAITLVPGQHALLNFSAASGQTLAFYLGSVSISPSTQNVAFTIVAPSGTTVASRQAVNNSSTTANLINLAAGTYSVLVTPNNFNSATTTMQVALATGVSDAVPTNGTSTSIQTYVPGQNAYLTFSGTLGESLGLGLTGLGLTPNSVTSTLSSISNPDGSSLTSAACYASSAPGCQVALQNLPQTGTYTTVISPSGQATQTLTITLSQDVSGALTLNQPTEISLASPGQYGDYTFTANGNQPLLLYVGSLSTSPSNSAVLLYVYNSSGALVTQSSITAAETSVNLGTLPAGNYSVLLVPNDAATATLQFALQPNASATLSPDGTPVQIATQAAGQNAYLSFSATAGQTFSLAVTGLTLAPASVSSVTIAISNPDGSSLTSTTCSTSTPGCEIRLRQLPQTGTYTAVVQASGQATIGFTGALWPDGTGTLSLGTPLTVTPQGAGQSAALGFTLASQQSVYVNLSSLSFTPNGTGVSESVFSSNGSLVGSLSLNSGTALELPNLPAGTYTIEIVPQYPVTGSFQALLTSGIGTSSFSTTTPGQAITIAFPGTAGESLGLGITELALSSGSQANITLTAPNGSFLIDGPLNANLPGTNFSFLNLPATGTYTIEISPPGQQTMTVNVTLAPPVVGSLSLSTPQSVSLVAGQYTWLSFTATAGQTLAINEGSIATIPAGQNVLLTVYNSSGASVGNVGASGSTGTLNLTNLPAGTYYAMASPGYAATATLQLTVAPGVTATQPVDGSTGSYSTSEPGQNAYLTFSGTAGEDIGLAITGLTVSDSNYANIIITEPDGSTLLLNTSISANHGNNFNLLNLPVTGTYSIEIAAANAQQTMTFNIGLSQPVTGNLALSTPQSVSLVAGQYTWLSFTATAGETLVLYANNVATTPAGENVQLTVYNSSGASVGSVGSGSSSTATLNLPNLAAGNYYVMASPNEAAASTLQLTIAPGVYTLPTVGSTGTYSTFVPGQNIYFQFSGTAGENIGIGIAALALSSGAQANIIVSEPNGNYLVDGPINANLPGTNFDLLNLPATGTYTIQIFPPGQQTMSFNLTLSQPVTGSLPLDTTLSVSLVAGQYTWLSFTATAGQTLAINESSIATTPARQNVQLIAYNSSGHSVGSVGASGNIGTLNLTNLAAGTYYVMASPGNAAAATLQLIVAPGVSATQPLDGSTSSYSTSEPGQNAYFQFSGTAGANVGMGITGLTVSSSNYANITVTEPNGNYLVNTDITTNVSGTNFNLRNLPVTGTYSIEIAAANAQQTMSLNLTLSQAVTGALALDTPQSVTLVAGQYTWLSFTATAGETVTFDESSIVTVPAAQNVQLTIYNSSGASMGTAGSGAASSATLELTDLAAGTYYVMASPSNAANATLQITPQ